MPRDVAEVVFASTPPVVVTNLVKNPGFENGLTDWTKGPTTSYTDPTISTTTPHGGVNCATYTSATATTGFYQDVPVTAGKTYIVSFWYKSSGDGSDTRIWCVYKDAAGTIIDQTPTPATNPLKGPNNGNLTNSDTWIQYSTEVVAPANVVTLQLAVRTYTGGTSNFDDFSVVEK